MKKTQAGFGLVEGLLALLIVALVVFVGWYVLHSNHKPSSNTSNASKTSQTTATKIPPFAQGINFILSTYNTYETSRANHGTGYNLNTIKSNLSPALYNQITNESLGYDPITCGQEFGPPSTGGNAPNRVAVERGTTYTMLVAQVDALTQDGGYYYEVGPSVTLDTSSMKITSIICPS